MTRKSSAIQEVLTAIQSERDKLQMSKEGHLEDSLQRALGALKQNYGVENPFVPTGSDAADYFKMFENVSEDFAQLGKELLKMRSSFLPFTMIEDVKKDLKNPGSGKSKKISEIIDADTTLESYENTFFRLLGMPSTDDIRDKRLITVTQKGVKRPWSDDMEFDLTNEVLKKRARPISDRVDHPSSTAYDFLSGAVPSFDRITQVGFTKTKELAEILVKIKELIRTRNRDLTSLNMANSLISLMGEHRSVDRADAQYQIQEVDNLRIIFGPAGTGPEGLRNAISAPKVLARALEIALIWLEPTVANKITLSMRRHLWNEHVLQIKNATMMHLQSDSNFWQYSYLMFPPVQDARVATCISEPSKMVAEPFLPESMRTVNGHKLKSTLLEAVIRIRLDAVSGFPHKAAQVNKTGMTEASGSDKRRISPDEMGILEALLIVRLFSALHGFAKDVNKKIKIAHEAQHRSKRAPSGEPPPETDHVPAPVEQKAKSAKQLELESLLLVEESLLLLFGDSSIPEALSYQEGVARNAGVKNAHLMGAAMSVLDVPRRWAEQELGKIKEVESRVVEKEGNKATGGLRAQLGVAKGVGAVDLLVYLIALFTAKETVLLSLLNDKQYEYLTKEYPPGFFDDFHREKIDTGRAVNFIAERAFDAYQLFKFMLTKQKPKFIHGTETNSKSNK